MDEYKKEKLPILAIIGFIGLIACASVSPISFIFDLNISGLGAGLTVGSMAAFFGVLIMYGVIFGG